MLTGGFKKMIQDDEENIMEEDPSVFFFWIPPWTTLCWSTDAPGVPACQLCEDVARLSKAGACDV